MLTPKLQQALDGAVLRLREALGDNLDSLIVYGSAVRGNVVPKVSDLNLLVVLRESTPEAHAKIAEAIRGRVRIEPFILGKQGFERSARAFAIKFLSIRRHYQILHGSDPLAGLEFPPALHRFLTEQALRNMRLRLVHAYVVHGKRRRWFSQVLLKLVTVLFTDLSEVMRLSGSPVPQAFAERIPVIAAFFGGGESILSDLLALKASPRKLSRAEIADYYGRLFSLLESVMHWIEARWEPPAPGQE